MLVQVHQWECAIADIFSHFHFPVLMVTGKCLAGGGSSLKSTWDGKHLNFGFVELEEIVCVTKLS